MLKHLFRFRSIVLHILFEDFFDIWPFNYYWTLNFNFQVNYFKLFVTNVFSVSKSIILFYYCIISVLLNERDQKNNKSHDVVYSSPIPSCSYVPW